MHVDRRPGRAATNGFFLLAHADQARQSSAIALEQITRAVAEKLSISVADIQSPSRRRIHTLARALIAWHATRNQVATLRAVARAMNRNAASIHSAIERYRELEPELFAQPLSDLAIDVTGSNTDTQPKNT
jgi:chromosomal replication initiation ATPase DnaA